MIGGALALVLGVLTLLAILGFVSVGFMSPVSPDVITFYVSFFPATLTLPLFHFVSAAQILSGWRYFDASSPRWVRRTATGWRVRLEPTARWLVGTTGLLILGACVLVVGLFSLGQNLIVSPRWEVAVVMWLVGLVPLATLCWKTPPDRWLEVDEQAKELRWIHCRTREQFVIPFSQIVGVRVIDARRIAPFAGTSCWFVSLRWMDGRWPQTTELARWMESSNTLNRQAEESAETLVDWLDERLRLGEGPHPPSPSPKRRGGVQGE